MTTLVDRLRLGEGTSPDHRLLLEAADEIERLSLPCDAWDSRCAQLSKLLADAKGHPAIDEYPRLRAALEFIRDGAIPQGMSPALFADRVLNPGPQKGPNNGN